MSVNTWIEEFYPKDAKSATASDMEATQHSLQKWTGALKKNLKAHQVTYDYGVITDARIAKTPHVLTEVSKIQFDSYSCALCQRYFINCLNGASQRCPIVRLLGQRCDSFKHTETNYYGEALHSPYIMVKLLKRTLKFLEKETTHD